MVSSLLNIKWTTKWLYSLQHYNEKKEKKKKWKWKRTKRRNKQTQQRTTKNLNKESSSFYIHLSWDCFGFFYAFLHSGFENGIVQFFIQDVDQATNIYTSNRIRMKTVETRTNKEKKNIFTTTTTTQALNLIRTDPIVSDSLFSFNGWNGWSESNNETK